MKHIRMMIGAWVVLILLACGWPVPEVQGETAGMDGTAGNTPYSVYSRLHRITVGQELELPKDLVPLLFLLRHAGYTSDDGETVRVTGEGKVIGLRTGSATIYRGQSPVWWKLCSIKVQTKKTIYLTFDDGPSNNVTGEILDILDKYGIEATFFVVGQYVRAYPGLVTEIERRGNVIGIHSDSHRYDQIYRSESALMNDVRKLENRLAPLLVNPPSVYRFPAGSFEVTQRLGRESLKSLVWQLNQKGYRCFDWDASLGDSSGTKDSERMLNNFIRGIKGKSHVVVLAHDMGKMEKTPEAIEKIIRYCRDQGYVFDTLDNYPGQLLFR